MPQGQISRAFPTLLQRGYRKPVRPVVDITHPLSKKLYANWLLGDGGGSGEIAKVTCPINLPAGVQPLDGTLNGFTGNPWAASHHGGMSLTFDGAATWVDIGASGFGFGAGSIYNVMAWIKTSTTGTCIVSNWNFTVTAGWMFGIGSLGGASSNKITIIYSDSGGSNYFGRYGATSVIDGNWHFVAMTNAGGGTTDLNLYVDGVLESMTDFSLGSGNPGALTDSSLRIGNRRKNATADSWFNGQIENVRIHDGVFSAGQIRQLYAEPYAGIVDGSKNYIGIATGTPPVFVPPPPKGKPPPKPPPGKGKDKSVMEIGGAYATSRPAAFPRITSRPKFPFSTVPAPFVRATGGQSAVAVNLPPAPPVYNQQNEQTTRNEIRRADSMAFKKGQDMRLQQGERFILKSSNGTLYSITVTDAGVITATAI